MVEKIIMTEEQKRTLVLTLVSEELAYEKYGGVQKAVDDAEALINKLTTDQIHNIFVAASKVGIEMITFGGKPQKYDTLSIVRGFIIHNQAMQKIKHGELDEDAKIIAQKSKKKKGKKSE